MSWRAASATLAALALGSAPVYAQDAPPPEPSPAAEAAPLGPEPPPLEMGPFPADATPAPATDAADDASGAPDPTYDRLFGEEEPAAPAAPVGPPRIQAPELPIWLWGILGLMLVALYFSRRNWLPKRGKDEGIDVRSRASLGKDGHLAVIEVGDGEGGRRRLLVGYGTGAPRLVADLTPIPDITPFSDALEEATAAEPAPVAARREPPAVEERPATPGESTSRRWEDALDQADEEATARHRPVRRPRNVALERRGDLIAEVLAERSSRTVEVGGDPDVAPADEDTADEKSAGGTTYTFRGRRG